MPDCPSAPHVPQEVLQRFRTMRDYDKQMSRFAQEMCAVIPEPTDLSDVLARLSALESSVTTVQNEVNTISSSTTVTECCTVEWISVSTTPYTIVDHNVGLLVDTSVARIVNLPLASDFEGETVYIKDDTGTAGTNNITVAPAGVETVDDDAVLYIDSDYACVQLQSNGVGWEIV